MAKGTDQDGKRTGRTDLCNLAERDPGCNGQEDRHHPESVGLLQTRKGRSATRNNRSGGQEGPGATGLRYDDAVGRSHKRTVMEHV